ncbi:hypothetical protein E2P81_ATG10069 [Venturia nashicola]|nr:hypothetical protein E2P81_ATG10069 [Venturia nashicola]
MKLSILATLGMISIASAKACRRATTYTCMTKCSNNCETPPLPPCGAGQYPRDTGDMRFIAFPKGCPHPDRPNGENEITRVRDCVSSRLCRVCSVVCWLWSGDTDTCFSKLVPQMTRPALNPSLVHFATDDIG